MWKIVAIDSHQCWWWVWRFFIPIRHAHVSLIRSHKSMSNSIRFDSVAWNVKPFGVILISSFTFVYDELGIWLWGGGEYFEMRLPLKLNSILCEFNFFFCSISWIYSQFDAMRIWSQIRTNSNEFVHLFFFPQLYKNISKNMRIFWNSCKEMFPQWNLALDTSARDLVTQYHFQLFIWPSKVTTESLNSSNSQRSHSYFDELKLNKALRSERRQDFVQQNPEKNLYFLLQFVIFSRLKPKSLSTPYIPGNSFLFRCNR